MKPVVFFFLLFLAFSAAGQQPGTLKSFKKIDLRPGSTLADSPYLWQQLGIGNCLVRDVDGDGNPELMVASMVDGFPYNGIIHQLRLDANGQPKRGFRYWDMRNYPSSPYFRPSQFYNFGAGSICNMGDINNDGVDDIAVGNPQGAGGNRGEVYIYYLNAAGGFDSVAQIQEYGYGLSTTLQDGGYFGTSPTSIGDLDGDGVPELAVGQPGFDTSRGRVWILFLRKDGRVKSWKTIGSGTANFMTLPKNTVFAHALTCIGDLDGDGVPDLMAGGSSGSTQRGAVWTLFLNRDGTVKGYKYYQPGSAEFPDTVQVNTYFAFNLSRVGDLDGDSVVDVAIGHIGYNDGGLQGAGRLWIWLMNRDGSIKGTQVIDKGHTPQLSAIRKGDNFGFAPFPLGDYNKDGIPDIGVGAIGDMTADTNGRGYGYGAIYLINLNGVPIKTRVGDIIINATKDFYAYPNPAADRLHIRSRTVSVNMQSVSLTDAMGRAIQTLEVNGQDVNINTSGLASGNYFIQVRTAHTQEVIQFQKN